jgi:hypothetical protein
MYRCRVGPIFTFELRDSVFLSSPISAALPRPL